MNDTHIGVGNHLLRSGSEIAAAVRDTFKALGQAVSDEAVKLVQGGDLIHPTPTASRRNRPHPWLHPTKGWRNFARPRKTNRRRKLIPQGRLEVFGE